MQQAVSRGSPADNARLDPRFRYLRVTIDRRVALLALGYVDRDARGPIEVWYSAQNEVLRLQNGRLVGLSGLAIEWRNVALPDLPLWSTLARDQKTLQWTRSRDAMPGYRYGVRDDLALGVLPQPPRSSLRDVDAERLTWFEERMQSSSTEKDALPPARYAVRFAGDLETVVYGEQCLAPDFCLSWQRWPAGS
jgi:Group 4 capsule polysaccharide lipoprotein gfcB, YjbF